jgi:hypothetical protein
MTDYAAATSQPILQGVVSVTTRGADGNVFASASFCGRGASRISIDPNGGIVIDFDEGLPGDVAVNPQFARALITMRGIGTPPVTGITEKSVTYVQNPDTSAFEAVRVQLNGIIPALLSPTPFFEIIVQRGDAGVEPANVNLIGGPQVILIP